MSFILASLLLYMSVEVNCFPPSASTGVREIKVDPRFDHQTPEDRGANWVEVGQHELPFYGRVEALARGEDGEDRAFLCGGTAINRRYVLTAAACFRLQLQYEKGLKPEKVEVYLDDTIWLGGDDPNEVLIRGEQVTLHPKFDKNTLENNIALVRLKEDIPDKIISVCLAKSAPKDKTPVTAAGFGIGAVKGPTSYSLQKSTGLKVRSTDKCRAKYKRFSKYSAVFCTYNTTPKGDQGPCTYDEGGPLFYEKAGKIVQVGLFSKGPVCGIPDFRSEFMDVSAFVPFIKSTVSAGGPLCIMD